MSKSDGDYHHLDLGGTAAVISNPKRVSKEFQAMFVEVFYQNNASKIEDSRRSLEFGTHCWLECVEQKGHLIHIRQVNIFVDIESVRERVWHLCRVACALLAIAKTLASGDKPRH